MRKYPRTAAASMSADAPAVIFQVRAFTQLEPFQLYALLQLRAAVFVVEQQCIYLDLDGRDAEATHVLGYANGSELVACARILPPVFPEAAVGIGRVVVANRLRRHGLGRRLLQNALDVCAERFPGPVVLSAQAHLQAFYANFGFVAVSEPYDEDGILHVKMRAASPQS
jgi:ElaA protein